MSLIDEALRKARIEGAQKEAERRGLPQPAPVGLPGRSRRGGGNLLTGALLGAALAAAAAAGLWWVMGRAPENQEARAPATRNPEPGELGKEQEAETPVASPASGAAEVAPAARPSGGPTPSDLGTPPPPAETDHPSQPPSAPRPAAPALAEPARAGASPSDTARSTQPPATTAPTPTEGGGSRAQAPGEIPVFRRTATLPGGRTITLNGIAWREDAPAAILDGQVVSPGEGVAGVTVVAIERDRVVLETESGRLVIRLP